MRGYTSVLARLNLKSSACRVSTLEQGLVPGSILPELDSFRPGDAFACAELSQWVETDANNVPESRI